MASAWDAHDDPQAQQDDAQHDRDRDRDRERERERPKRGGGGWRFATFLAILLLLAAAGAAGFYYLVHLPMSQDSTAAAGRISRLERENGRMEARLEQLAGEHAAALEERDRAAEERDRLRGEQGALRTTVQEREAQIAALESATRDLRQRLGAEIADGTVSIRGSGSELSVGLSDRVLFPSGQDQLTPQGKALLRRVAESLRGVQDRVIQVEGHTDGVNPSPALRERFPTNWELSAARAI